jgi:hypothetical protein
VRIDLNKFLWLVEPISNDVKLIAFITSLPSKTESLTQYLDDKIKEKALVKEMKKKNEKERGSCRIIIKRISDATTRMTTKLMACKLLHKCHKEEVHVGVVAAPTQCINGTILSWAPYLLNLFLDNCKDTQDLGTSLIKWKEPP